MTMMRTALALVPVLLAAAGCEPCGVQRGADVAARLGQPRARCGCRRWRCRRRRASWASCRRIRTRPTSARSSGVRGAGLGAGRNLARFDDITTSYEFQTVTSQQTYSCGTATAADLQSHGDEPGRGCRRRWSWDAHRGDDAMKKGTMLSIFALAAAGCGTLQARHVLTGPPGPPRGDVRIGCRSAGARGTARGGDCPGGGRRPVRAPRGRRRRPADRGGQAGLLRGRQREDRSGEHDGERYRDLRPIKRPRP